MGFLSGINLNRDTETLFWTSRTAGAPVSLDVNSVGIRPSGTPESAGIRRASVEGLSVELERKDASLVLDGATHSGAIFRRTRYQRKISESVVIIKIDS